MKEMQICWLKCMLLDSWLFESLLTVFTVKKITCSRLAEDL